MPYEKFFDFIHENYGIETEGDPRWSIIASQLDPKKPPFDALLDWLMQSYPKNVKLDPGFVPLLNTVFQKTFIKILSVINNHSEWPAKASCIFNSWTLFGTRDLLQSETTHVSLAFHEMLFTDEYHAHSALEIISESPELWELLGSTILKIASCFSEDVSIPEEYQIVIHRHAPHLTQFYDEEGKRTFYAMMCGADLQVKLTLSEMRPIFTGLHNNTLAWNTALEECTQTDWMDMLPTFSSLHLDPQDPEAWVFWESLKNITPRDVSGKNFMATLAEVQSAMHQSFTTSWSIINTLYEGDERYTQAAQMHREPIVHHNALPVPDFYI